MIGAIEVIDAADGELVDRKDRSWGQIQQFVLLYSLCTGEKRILLLKNGRRFENEAVQRVARLQHLSSPCKRRAPDVVLAKGLRVNRRGGETILVSFGFQLLRRIQMAPRDLEAQ